MDFNRIKILTKEKGRTINELCQYIDYTEAGLHKMVKAGSVKVSTLEVIAKFLEVDVATFFDIENKSLVINNPIANHKKSPNEKEIHENVQEKEKSSTNPKNDQEMSEILQYQKMTITALQGQVDLLMKENKSLMERLQAIEGQRNLVKTRRA